ncbi:MAG: porin family protein [Candidatus Syntrophosphaera sp.]
MNKLLIAALVLILAAVSANAETNFGLRGGVNNTTLAGDDAPSEIESRSGVHGGLMMQIWTGGAFLIQPELLYSQRGTYRDYLESDLITIENTNTFNYIEVPLLFKLNLNIRDTRLQPYVGPEGRYLISAESETVTTTTIGNDTETDTSSEEIDNLKDLDYGLCAGLDIEVFGDLLIGARYNMGMANIQKVEDGQEEPDIQNRGLMLTVGLSF